ncbi:uncharacterized protein CIMG_13190 [Coccidioides immitis RS]|uniref:Uncharacterized protein n=1 Tax=Coccidioides immitis (strain RS) TaxID=246410 RepID=A0A0E1RW47_COCIM|nr:uncharacterized protein CIMG_13190 [Coccidioides immitis RS]EAS29827.2 hypothetical protein CIMG_13190 [Coccidioides immitis RS]
MSAFKASAINTQDLINRILQLKQIIKRLGEQNHELKDHNKQLETQIMAIPSTGQQKKKDKAKVNLPEFFKNEQEKLQAFLKQLCIYINIKGKELSNNKNKIIITNYYKKDKVNQNNNMLKIINSYNIFIQILKTTFREVKKQNTAAQQLHYI